MGGIAFFFLVILADRGGTDEYEGPLTRGEFVRRVVAVLDAPAMPDPVFTDVPVTAAVNPYITAAVERGILRPLEVGLELGAEGPIPPAEAIELVVRALGAGAVGETMLRSHLTGSWFGNETTQAQAHMLIDAMGNTLAELTAAQASEHAVEYHTHVVVIENPPFYSYTEEDGYFTVIVYLADDKIRALAVGDTFVFEPTAENPGGISGHVTDVYYVVGGAIITARKPLVLSEIFIQFGQGVAFGLLNGDAEIIPADHGAGNRWDVTREGNEVRVSFDNRGFPGGITLDGDIVLSNPRVYASFGLTHMEYLKSAAEARFDGLTLSRAQPGEGDPEAAFIELFTIYSVHEGVWVEFLVGLHIASDGEFSLEIGADFDAAFGIREGRVSARSRIGYSFEYAHHYTRAEFALELEARVRLLGIPVYGIRGAFGRGFTATEALQTQCHGGVCFVVGIFDVRRVRSLTDWGALRNSAALRFGEDFAYDGLYDTWYIYRGAHRRYSVHPENFETVPEEIGE
jgi:hypothetical protein